MEKLTFNFDDVLTCAAWYVRHEGWIPRNFSTLDGDATADKVLRRLVPPARSEDLEEWRLEGERLKFTAEDLEMVFQVTLWLASLEDFTYFLARAQTIMRSEEVSLDEVEIVCGIIPHWLEKRCRVVPYGGGEYLGIVGERTEIDVEVDAVYEKHSNSSGYVLCRMYDARNNEVVWFATPSAVNSLRPGMAVRISGKVKRHGEYEGRKQTVLSHVRVLSKSGN